MLHDVACSPCECMHTLIALCCDGKFMLVTAWISYSSKQVHFGLLWAPYHEFWAPQSLTQLHLKVVLLLRRTRAADFPRKKKMPNFGACCAHDHDCEAADCGPSWSLHEHIDMSKVSLILFRADPAQWSCPLRRSFLLCFPWDVKGSLRSLTGGSKQLVGCRFGL